MISQQTRTFVAVAISGEARAEIGAMMQSLGLESNGIRWTPKANLHLTLKFIGDIDQQRISDLGRAISAGAEGLASFHYIICGTGCFPSWHRPRVLWLGIHDSENILVELQHGIDHHLHKIGIPKETRSYTPHLTIGRVRQVDAVKEILTRFRTFELGEFRVQVNQIDIIKSELRQSGARYTVLHSIPLLDPHSKSQSPR